MKISTYINLHKSLVIPVVLAMMAYWGNWSTEAFVYLAIHGTYCILWLIKHATFPDARFTERRPLWMGLPFAFLALGGYFVAPYLLISRHLELPPALIGVAIAVFTMGVFLHFVSDAQKYFLLAQERRLITSGLFRRVRNPNYLGEILIYLAFAMFSMHWLPFLIVGGWVFGFFVPNMLAKDRSLARYPEFAEYKRTSGLVLPKLW